MEALYRARRLETAWLEAQQSFPFKAQPMTLCIYEVDCEDVFDLTDPGECNRLGITDAGLSCPWESIVARREVPPSWMLARRLFAEGASGILVRSFAPGAGPADVTAVFWRWSDRPSHQVRVVDDEWRLPRNDSSWR